MGMSQALAGPGDWLDPRGFGANPNRYRTYFKLGDMTVPGPASTYVLLDEHPDSINAGGFANETVEEPGAARIIDYPASYHNKAGGLSFADGHSEIKKWRDARTFPSLKKGQDLPLDRPSPNR